MDTVATIAAMRACIAACVKDSLLWPNMGFGRDGSVIPEACVRHPLDDGRRMPGLPGLDLLPGFLWEGDIDLVATAVHEAGHAAVALRHGVEVVGIGTSHDGYPVTIHASSHDLDVDAAIHVAGFLSEILVYGTDAVWQFASSDMGGFLRNERLRSAGAHVRGHPSLWQRALAARIRQPRPRELADALSRIPDSAFENAIAVLPAVLAIAEVAVRREHMGDILDGSGIETLFDAVMKEVSLDEGLHWPLVPDTERVQWAVEHALSLPDDYRRFYSY